MPRRNHFKQSSARRYRERSYKNPHIQLHAGARWKRGAVALALLSTFASAAFFFLGHPRFDVKNIQVRGLEHIDRGKLEQAVRAALNERAALFFRRANRFLFSAPDLQQMLGESFALASARVGLKEDTLFITLEERTSNLFWETGGQLYVVDLDGIVAREAGEEERRSRMDLPLFIDLNGVDVQPGSVVLKPLELEHAFLFLERLAQSDIFTTHIEIDRLAGKWVKVVTLTGYGILIDLSGDMEAQYRHLIVVLNEQIDDPSTLEYIDLRFGDRVYFR